MTFRRFTALCLIAILCLTLCACGKKEEPVAGMANPLHEATQESILETVGISFQVPANAEDVTFWTIDTDPVTAQMKFSFDGDEYCYRVSSTAEYTDISGMYYEWENEDSCPVQYNEANVYWNDFKEGVILWYDAAPGMMYSLSQNTNATFGTLDTMANALYEPTQGDVDGVDDSFETVLNGYLADIQQNYHAGVAGCSLKGTAFACSLLDLFTGDMPDATQVKDIVAAFAAGLGSDAAAEFKGQMADIADYAERILADGEAAVDGCGYEPLYMPYDKGAMAPYIEALTLK